MKMLPNRICRLFLKIHNSLSVHYLCLIVHIKKLYFGYSNLSSQLNYCHLIKVLLTDIAQSHNENCSKNWVCRWTLRDSKQTKEKCLGSNYGHPSNMYMSLNNNENGSYLNSNPNQNLLYCGHKMGHESCGHFLKKLRTDSKSQFDSSLNIL